MKQHTVGFVNHPDAIFADNTNWQAHELIFLSDYKTDMKIIEFLRRQSDVSAVVCFIAQNIHWQWKETFIS